LFTRARERLDLNQFGKQQRRYDRYTGREIGDDGGCRGRARARQRASQLPIAQVADDIGLKGEAVRGNDFHHVEAIAQKDTGSRYCLAEGWCRVTHFLPVFVAKMHIPIHQTKIGRVRFGGH
jgi:hypothetical protein